MLPKSESDAEDSKSSMLALSSNIQKIQATMKEVDILDTLLRREQDESEGKVSGKIIEIKGTYITTHYVLCV